MYLPDRNRKEIAGKHGGSFYDTTIKAAAMKIARNVPEQEVLDFLNEMKYTYELTPSEKLKQKPVIQQRLGRRKGPRL